MLTSFDLTLIGMTQKKNLMKEPIGFIEINCANTTFIDSLDIESSEFYSPLVVAKSYISVASTILVHRLSITKTKFPEYMLNKESLSSIFDLEGKVDLKLNVRKQV